MFLVQSQNLYLLLKSICWPFKSCKEFKRAYKNYNILKEWVWDEISFLKKKIVSSCNLNTFQMGFLFVSQHENNNNNNNNNNKKGLELLSNY